MIQSGPFIQGPAGRRLRALFVLGLTVLMAGTAARAEDDIKSLYDSAIKDYTSGKYSDAIRCWQRIIQIDPAQAPPAKMIKFTRQKIKKELSPKIAAFEKYVAAGKWYAALNESRKIMDLDPTYPGVAGKKKKLEQITVYFKDSSSKRGVSRYVRKAVEAYMNDQPDKIFDAIIYAGQINRDKSITKSLAGLRSYLEGLYPEERSKVKIIAGMTLVPQLLQSSLDSIYKADYTGAIIACNRVLYLEPREKMALMRKGSAYYALKKYGEAEKNWRAVLKIDPGNKDVKKFLKALKRQRARSRGKRK